MKKRAEPTSEGGSVPRKGDGSIDWRAYERARRAKTMDGEVSLHGEDKQARMDLGLVLLQRRAIYGVPLTSDDQALFMGCSPQGADRIFQRALRKVKHFIATADPALAEELRSFFLHERQPARRTRPQKANP